MNIIITNAEKANPYSLRQTPKKVYDSQVTSKN